MPKYDFLIFDMDGTFIDSAPFHIAAYHRFFDTHEIEVSMGDTILGLGFTIEEMFRNIGVPEERVDEVYEKLAAFYKGGVDDLMMDIPLIDGAKEVFNTLADRGYPMSVVTNSLQPAAERILDLHGLQDYFKAVEGATQKESDKEKRCMDVCDAHCKEGRVLLIGDAGRDMEIAKDAGWDCCLAVTDIAWARDPQSVIDQFDPTYVINGFPELLQILD
ncbi:MAG: HAD-IA family hydrolase [Christensenella sp.]|uniref:HAD family hydrolase n=1 Tax=Christensenella sp. TaxID=1935934 RepID=UPI002B1F945B|nr:HAD-IA family hydrolase [Christensenella sp.]MEA5004533.1 HAD-IA family hydrolase [Christensenella sp.]